MDSLVALAQDPAVWAALITLVVMEVVLGIDNLVFISILSNKLPAEQRSRARRIGLSMALVMRMGLLSTLAFIVSLTQTVVSLPFSPALDAAGHRPFEFDFSWRDLILIGGGLFLIWKATSEIHTTMSPSDAPTPGLPARAAVNFGAAIFQILLLDLVFSVDSILTAVGMTDDLPVMIVAVTIAVLVMMFAADPLANFIHDNPSVVMLALGFLLMIGTVLIADGFGVHIPKGYIYTAMAFSAGVEALNIMTRRARIRSQQDEQSVQPDRPSVQSAD